MCLNRLFFIFVLSLYNTVQISYFYTLSIGLRKTYMQSVKTRKFFIYTVPYLYCTANKDFNFINISFS